MPVLHVQPSSYPSEAEPSTICPIVLVPYYATVVSPWQYHTFCALSTYLQSYLRHTSTVRVRQRFVNFSLRKNKYPHKAAVGKTQPAQLPALFKYFCQSQFLSLPFRASV